MLLEGFLRLARARRGTNVFLEVRKSNQAARLLYEKAGFVEAGRRKDYYRQPDEDALVLRFSFF
jgi:ribosomal-protein-alanine N-acetyltransferase